MSRDTLMKLLNRKVISVLGLVLIIFLTSGGVYVIIESPGAMVSTSSGGSSFIARSTSSQTSVELFVAFFLTLGGAVGFILLEGAMKETFDPAGAKVKYVLAIMLIVVTILLLEYVTYAKIS